MPQIDPEKEVNAAKSRVELGVSTLDRETSSLGCGDFQDNQPQIRKERKFVQEVGLWTPLTENKSAAAKEDPSTDRDMGEEMNKDMEEAA